jgi:macrolide transport system ATP-binding/permease protein
MFRSFWLRLCATFRPGMSERRLEEEFSEHLQALTVKQAEQGLAPDEAVLAARREFGPVEAAKEQYRDQLRFRLLENSGRDLRFALRQCRKNPGFTAAAVLSLAFGIGANTALFSFINTLLLKELAVPDANQLVILKNSGKALSLSYDQLNNLERETNKLDGLAGTYPLDVSVQFGNQPQWVSAELVTGDYFSSLRVKPERGRLMTARDLEDAQGNPTCVISERLWRNQFHGAEDVVGRTLLLNTRPYKIIGVSERGFTGVDLHRPIDLQIPATRLIDYMPAFVGLKNFNWKSQLSLFSALGRLKKGVAKTDAAGQLTRINRLFLKSDKLDNNAMEIQVADGQAGLESSAPLAKPAAILLGVSLVVLLIACANLATLLLSRISARAPEFALRLAIGSSQKRILAQILMESALLVVLGTAAGLIVADVIRQSLLRFLNRTVPPIHHLHVTFDGTVLAFVAAIATICVLLFGAAPALYAARTVLLRSSAGNSHNGVILRKTFVVAQIALSFIVVLSAGLLTGTLRNLTAVSFSFRPDEIAAIEIRPAAGGYSGSQANQFYIRLVDHLRTLPGVKAASTAFGANLGSIFKVKLDPLRPSDATHEINMYGVNAGYFDTFGARVLAGRDFKADDASAKQEVYIISEHLANTYFHGENPVGRYLRRGSEQLPVIGVVSDLHDLDPREANLDAVYHNAGQLLVSSLTVFVRCQGSCTTLLPTLSTEIRKREPNTPLLSIRTLQTEREGAFSSQQVLGFLSTLFAILAMLLVATGIYGVLSYTFLRRTREIGIRIALGASAPDIVRLFISEAASMIILGTLIGVPSALAAVTLLQSQLFGVSPHDPQMLLICMACIAITVVLASATPIRRALCIAPQQALRTE